MQETSQQILAYRLSHDWILAENTPPWITDESWEAQIKMKANTALPACPARVHLTWAKGKGQKPESKITSFVL